MKIKAGAWIYIGRAQFKVMNRKRKKSQVKHLGLKCNNKDKKERTP